MASPFSPQILQDLVVLQGNEIVRLKSELEAATNRILVLEKELKESRGTREEPRDTTDLESGGNIPNIQWWLRTQIPETQEDPQVDVDTNVQSLEGEIPFPCVFPIREGTALDPLCAKSGKQSIKDAMKVSMVTEVPFITLKWPLVFWTDTTCNKFVALVPQDRMKSDGTVDRYFAGFMLGEQEVFVDAPDKQRYYLGKYIGSSAPRTRYRRTGTTVVPYDALPNETKTALIDMSCPMKQREATAAKYEEGTMAPRRMYYRRIGFDRDLYARLRSVAPATNAPDE